MDYLTIQEAADRWGVGGRRVTYYCLAGHIADVIRKSNMWLIPVDAEKPKDGRYKANGK